MSGTHERASTPAPTWAELGAFAARAFGEGSLHLRHLVGLTDEELRAISDVAEDLRRSGELEQAASLYGLLVAYDPLQASHWRALAGLQQRLGQHALAVACFEVLALLAEREATATRSEARSLAQLGQPELASAMTRWAESLAERRNLVDAVAARPNAGGGEAAPAGGGFHG